MSSAASLQLLLKKCAPSPIATGDTSATLRERVNLLEKQMLQRVQFECPLYHHFSKGLYIRELHVKKGVLSTGKIHKAEHTAMLIKGVRDVVIGGQVKTLTAPYITKVKPGSKLCCYTWEDSIWMTIHPNPDDERDIPTLEARYVCDTEQEYLEYVASSQKVIECHS